MLLFISGPQISGTQLQLKWISQPSLSGESCSDSTLVSQVVKLDREVSSKTNDDSHTNVHTVALPMPMLSRNGFLEVKQLTVEQITA